jgi:hypothetical protein
MTPRDGPRTIRMHTACPFSPLRRVIAASHITAPHNLSSDTLPALGFVGTCFYSYLPPGFSYGLSCLYNTCTIYHSIYIFFPYTTLSILIFPPIPYSFAHVTVEYWCFLRTLPVTRYFYPH